MAQLSDERLLELKSQIPKRIGEKIRELRRANKITQSELASFVGKDRQYIYKIEKGVVTPNIVTITALAIAMEVSLRDVFEIEL